MSQGPAAAAFHYSGEERGAVRKGWRGRRVSGSSAEPGSPAEGSAAVRPVGAAGTGGRQEVAL